MLRSFTVDRGPAATGITDVPLALDAVRILVFVVVLITVPLAQPHLGSGADGIGVAVALGVSTASWVVYLLARRRPRAAIVALSVTGVAGGVLAGLSPLSTAIAVGCVVTSTAGTRLNPETSLAITAGTVAAFLAAALATGAPTGTLLGYPLTFIGLWAFGLSRHAFLLRAEQAERMLAESRRAREAETQAAALAERARIAREIHDVLAHSLAAVSVNLQAAEGLLGALPAGRPELAKALECIGRAGVFTGRAWPTPGARSWPCAMTRPRWPISWPRWPGSTGPMVTWPSTSPSRARRGRSLPRRPWLPTGPPRRR